jgi:bacteriocin resistance YdeI/OmpD-like protein/uncharacterized protein DUF1905
MAREKFTALLQVEGKTATFIEVPLDVPAIFGGKRVSVRGTINGFPFRSTIAAYGDRFYLPVNKGVREGAGASAGETVTVELERDEDPRKVDIPADLAEALKVAPSADKTFKGLSYTHQKEYASWITEAKRDATRRSRVEKTISLLRAGEKHP